MSISLPGSRRLSLNTDKVPTLRTSNPQSSPSLRFTSLSMPASLQSPKQSTEASRQTTKPASPAALAQEVSGGRWVLTPHLELLNRALVYLAQRVAPVSFIRELGYDVAGVDSDLVPFTRLIVEMPPRHGKSELVSRYFPAWYEGMNPHHRVILTSYAADFARSWGRKARDILKEHGSRLFGVTVKRTTTAGNDWEIEGTDGGMITAGVGGPITGRGANLLIVDDAVKNAEEAASQTIQERNADWWDSTAYTRIEPDGIAVVMATRWHEKDLTGHILGLQDVEDGDRDGDLEDEFWYVLKLPALAEANDVLGRQPGEALWPARYSVARLQRIAQRIGSYFFGALFQQRPSSEDGNIFKRGWWQEYDTLPLDLLAGATFVDTAGYDDKTTGDYAVLSTVYRHVKDLYWTDVQRGHWQFPELRQRCIDTYEATKKPIVIEDTPWAKPLIQSLQKVIPGVIAFKVEGKSKLTRAQAVSPFAEGGNFYLPRKAAWKSAFIEEHAAFPHGAHDDMVDTTSMAGLRLLIGGLMGGQPTVTEMSWSPPKPASKGLRRYAAAPATTEKRGRM